MIEISEGRSRSVFTVDELDASVKRELASLTPDELETLQKMIDCAQAGDYSLVNAVQSVDMIRPKVDIEEFVYSDEYLGATCKNLYPRLMEDLRELFSGSYNEAILTGSTGWGKCVCGDTEIYDCSIGKLVRVDQWHQGFVLSWDGGKSVPKPAYCQPAGVKTCYQVYTDSHHNIRCSEDHPFYTKRGKVNACELKETDYLLVVDYKGGFPQKVYWSKVSNVQRIGSRLTWDLCVPDTHWFFGNGILVHNTFFASIGICWILYELSLLRDPQETYGLAAHSNIALVCTQVNEALAMKVTFDNIATKLRASPYFQENFPFRPTRKELKFPRDVTIYAKATTDTSTLGLNVLAHLQDESNFLTGKPKGRGSSGENLDTAAAIYTNIKRRMQSRFEKRGKLPGMLFIVSSKNSPDDFTNRRILASETDSRVFVRDYATWDVRPSSYSKDRFTVFVGNDTVPSRILLPEEVAGIKATKPDDCVLLEVPEDFRQSFDSDLEGAIRDLGGVAMSSKSKFIQRREKLKNYHPNLRHPFSKEIYCQGDGGYFLWEQMVGITPVVEHGQTVTQMLPLWHPSALRYVHIDPSLRNDKTGISMVHIAGEREMVRTSPNGEKYKEVVPVYGVDLMLQVTQPMGGEIQLSDLRAIVYDLGKHGYPIARVTVDTYQSADMIQQMTNRGYLTEVLSVDLTPEPYDSLKRAFYEDRVIWYEYPPIVNELKFLEEVRKGARRKIDHPELGSKDCADSLAGACFSAMQSMGKTPMGEVVFGIGDTGVVPIVEPPKVVGAEGQEEEDSGTMSTEDNLPFLM